MENVYSTWLKRFMQTHYSYRDFHSVTTSVLVELQVLQAYLLALAAGSTSTTSYYVFGTNARARLNPFASPTPLGAAAGAVNWPANCFAREVAVRCTADAWIALICTNPEYLKEAVIQGYTGTVATAQALIVEEEQFIGEYDEIVFLPTYGYAILFRADSEAGTMRIYVEGNVEGTE